MNDWKKQSVDTKAQEELDLEGKSIIDEKSQDLNNEKTAGKGTLKVRFQMASPGRKSMSEAKNVD